MKDNLNKKKVMNIVDSGLVKATLNLILYEQNSLADLETEYEVETAKTILKLKPTDETAYKLAELQAKIEHNELRNKILKQKNTVESLYSTLNHKEEVEMEFKKFEEDKQEVLELMKKILGE